MRSHERFVECLVEYDLIRLESEIYLLARVEDREPLWRCCLDAGTIWLFVLELPSGIERDCLDLMARS